MRNNLKIAVISVIGVLTFTVISAMTINSVPVVNAKNNCGDNGCKAEAFGSDINRDKDDGPDSNPANGDEGGRGYGDEVSVLAKDKDPATSSHNGMNEFREAGESFGKENFGTTGKSGEDHGNDP